MYINDKNAQLKRLKDIKTRADQDIRTTEDIKLNRWSVNNMSKTIPVENMNYVVIFSGVFSYTRTMSFEYFVDLYESVVKLFCYNAKAVRIIDLKTNEDKLFTTLESFDKYAKGKGICK